MRQEAREALQAFAGSPTEETGQAVRVAFRGRGTYDYQGVILQYHQQMECVDKNTSRSACLTCLQVTLCARFYRTLLDERTPISEFHLLVVEILALDSAGEKGK